MIKNDVIDPALPSESDALPIQESPSIPASPRFPMHPKRKRMWTLLSVFVLLLAGVGAVILSQQRTQDMRSRAAATGTTLALDPAAKTAAVGETVSIGAVINTNSDTVAAAELHLTYDPTAIQIINFTLQTGLVMLTPETHTNGAITVTLGVSPTSPFKGSGIIGTWTVKTLANKQSSIAFTSATQVAALGKTTNALASTTGSTITGTTTESITPTPTFIPGVTPTPTSSPGVTPTGTPSANDADIDNNGSVNIVDYTLFMSGWWLNNYDTTDLNDDGKISVIDYTIFMNGWNDNVRE